MPNFRKVAASAYMVAFLLFAIPLFDVSVELAPWQVRNSQWRFAFLGLVCNALMIPASGALIAVVTAVVNDHEKAKKWMGRTFWVFAVGCVIAIMVFALDAMQASSKIVPAMILSYRVSVMTATVKWFLGAVTFSLFALACGVPAPRAPKAPKAGPQR